MIEKRLKILQAAINTITRYGYRRTSMEDIAKDAGISRPAIYMQFKNKEAVALAALELVNRQGFEAAENAANDKHNRADALTAYLTAYMIFYYRLIFNGRHTAELMQLKQTLGNDSQPRTKLKLVAAINAFLNLSENDEAGLILAAAAEGLKLSAPNEDTLSRQIRILVQKFSHTC